MSLTDSLLVSAFSIALVFFVLVMLSLLIVIFSKILEAAKVRSEKKLCSSQRTHRHHL